MLLNYGHSFGHAIEAATKYQIPHGIAVAHGMNIANYISFKYNYISKDEYLNMKNILSKIWCKYLPKKIRLDKYINLLKKDKKNTNDKLKLILTKGIGSMFIKEVKPNKKFINYLRIYFNDNF